MKLSIIIPAYNEEKSINKIISAVKNVKLPCEKEIIVIDDCSKDKTLEIIRKIKGIKVFFHEKNKGKGAAMRTGASKATGDYILWQDADLEYDPEDLRKIIETAIKNKLEVVYGSRNLEKKNKYSYVSYYLGNLFLNVVTSILYFSKITDMETGYKLVKNKLVGSLNLRANKFDIEPEITAKILKKGIKIVEVPISYKPRSIKEGKKIRWKDGLTALWTLIKYRFGD
ncbi:MAG: glycosyltransferase family 2 protein [Candidatus Pacearchaeota archaeon]|nr:glycosyltransferase family 2 protein [Candidatus Pacearchaeota archaeon]